MPPSSELARRGRHIHTDLKAANDKIKSGAQIDLTLLEGRIRGFCAALSLLPNEQAKDFEGLLEHFILLLDQLEKSVNTQLASGRRRLAALEIESSE